MRPTVGAVICAYGDSGHLIETVRRVYNSLDCIYILLGVTPWSCSDFGRDHLATYGVVSQLFDPEQKITIVSRRWASEHEQRNYGKDLLYKRGIEWCMVLDDDELYNPDQLEAYIPRLNKSDNMFIYLVPMHVYWKSREYVLPNSNTSYPVFVRTDPTKTVFTKARAADVMGGNWESTTHAELAMHHLSYVRSDDQVQKKVARFSHAEQFDNGWFAKWMAWEPGQDAILDSGTVHKVQKLEKPIIKPCGYVPWSNLELLLTQLAITVESDPLFQGLSGCSEFIVKIIRSVTDLEKWNFKVYLHNEIPGALKKLSPETAYIHIAKWEMLIVEL